MISHEAPRKSLQGCHKPENSGFWLDGTDYSDCIRQLKEYAAQHREKWIYFHDCGIEPGYPIPVARQLFEVGIFDAEPAAIMWSWRLFQKGAAGRREIDEMSLEERSQLRAKQGLFFAMLGSSIYNSENKP